jgi:hypothetical protein
VFFVTYLRRELLGRPRQAAVIPAGLGLGIGMVVVVSALSSGVRGAQGKLLGSLYGVGTDITVTTGRPAGLRVGRVQPDHPEAVPAALGHADQQHPGNAERVGRVVDLDAAQRLRGDRRAGAHRDHDDDPGR